jgi:hypothetical protein
MSSAQENKAVSRKVAEEIFNEGKLDLADELLGIPPTGRRSEISGITINRFSGAGSRRIGTRATTWG